MYHGNLIKLALVLADIYRIRFSKNPTQNITNEIDNFKVQRIGEILKNILQTSSYDIEQENIETFIKETNEQLINISSRQNHYIHIMQILNEQDYNKEKISFTANDLYIEIFSLFQYIFTQKKDDSINNRCDLYFTEWLGLIIFAKQKDGSFTQSMNTCCKLLKTQLDANKISKNEIDNIDAKLTSLLNIYDANYYANNGDNETHYPDQEIAMHLNNINTMLTNRLLLEHIKNTVTSQEPNDTDTSCCYII